MKSKKVDLQLSAIPFNGIDFVKPPVAASDRFKPKGGTTTVGEALAPAPGATGGEERPHALSQGFCPACPLLHSLVLSVEGVAPSEMFL